MDISKETRKSLDFERIKLLYRNGFYGFLGVLVNSCFLVLFFWNNVNQQILILWMVLVILISIARFLLGIIFNSKFKNQQDLPDNIQIWEWRAYAGLFTSRLLWTATIFFPFQENLFGSLIFIALAHVGMTSAANTIYATSLISIQTYLTITMIPLTVRLFSLQGDIFMIVGAMCSAYYIFMIRMNGVLNKTIIDNIKLKLENEDLSLKDPLTGLGNRRRLYMFMEKLIPLAQRHKLPFSLILLDVDNFKQYNDTEGHNAGDKLLIQISEIIQSMTRDADLAVRYGGEEFLIVLPDTDVSYAKKVGERILKSVKENTSTTISAGLTSYLEKVSLDELILRADKSLYRAKESGKDQIVEYNTNLHGHTL